MEKPLITVENLETLPYRSEAGVRYEITPGCIRTMKEVTIGLDKAYSNLMATENAVSVDTEAGTYWSTVRLEAALMITDGDTPENPDDIYIKIINRVVADFLRLRSLSLTKPGDLPVPTPETQE